MWSKITQYQPHKSQIHKMYRDVEEKSHYNEPSIRAICKFETKWKIFYESNLMKIGAEIITSFRSFCVSLNLSFMYTYLHTYCVYWDKTAFFLPKTEGKSCKEKIIKSDFHDLEKKHSIKKTGQS